MSDNEIGERTGRQARITLTPDVYADIVSKHAVLSEIITKCAAENRAPSSDEQTKLNTIKSEIDSIKSDWESAGRNAFLAGLAVRKDVQPRFLKNDETLAKSLEGTYAPELKQASLGRLLRGYVTGNWDGADLEQKAMGSTPLSSGGILIPTPLAANVIDLARNQARVLQAGAITVPMSTATLRYARQTQDVTANWVSEANDIPVSAAAFDSVLFTAHKLAAMVVLDNELLEDAPNTDGVIENSISKSLALALDFTALYGTGIAPQPQGLHGIVPAVPAGGLATYDLMLQAIEEITAANFIPNAVIYSARTANTLAKQKNSLGDYLTLPAAFTALQKLVTNQVPNNLGTGANESQAFVGQWDELALGLRSSLQIEVSREASYFDGTVLQSTFSKDQTVIRAILRADWQVLQTAAFAEVTGIAA